MSAPTRNGALAPAGAPELTFAVEGSAAEPYAAVPTLVFRVRIGREGGAAVRSIALNTQIRVAATQRPYDDATRERLAEVFGRGDQWARGVRSLPWVNVTTQVPAFTDSAVVELPVTCTYDFEVTTARYFHALEEGEIPLELLFSGTVFYPGQDGALQIAHIPWEKEAEHRMPVGVWRELMDRYFPGAAWLRLDRERFGRLHAYRVRHGLLTWEDAVDALLREAT